MKAKKTPEKKTDDNKKWNKSSDKKDEQKHKIHYYDEKLYVKKKANKSTEYCLWNAHKMKLAREKYSTNKTQNKEAAILRRQSLS